MNKLLAVCVAALVLGGCATKRVEVDVPVVQAQRIEVPVLVIPEVPAALAECGTTPAPFRFHVSPDNERDAVLREKDQPLFRGWINEKDRCLRAWRLWGER